MCLKKFTRVDPIEEKELGDNISLIIKKIGLQLLRKKSLVILI